MGLHPYKPCILNHNCLRDFLPNYQWLHSVQILHILDDVNISSSEIGRINKQTKRKKKHTYIPFLCKLIEKVVIDQIDKHLSKYQLT